MTPTLGHSSQAWPWKSPQVSLGEGINSTIHHPCCTFHPCHTDHACSTHSPWGTPYFPSIIDSDISEELQPTTRFVQMGTYYRLFPSYLRKEVRVIGLHERENGINRVETTLTGTTVYSLQLHSSFPQKEL